MLIAFYSKDRLLHDVPPRLCVDGRDAKCCFFQNIQQNTNSIQCCEHGYVVFYGALTDFPAIAVLHVVDVSGVDYIAYIAVTDGFDDFIAAVADFRSYSGAAVSYTHLDVYKRQA